MTQELDDLIDEVLSLAEKSDAELQQQVSDRERDLVTQAEQAEVIKNLGRAAFSPIFESMAAKLQKLEPERKFGARVRVGAWDVTEVNSLSFRHPKTSGKRNDSKAAILVGVANTLDPFDLSVRMIVAISTTYSGVKHKYAEIGTIEYGDVVSLSSEEAFDKAKDVADSLIKKAMSAIISSERPQ
ncbi:MULTISPECIES: hypothetical protein [Sorangium]|uniref:Uncharacterized protein n=1 Tax=Sorangium cellulosum TaxID=56 RepID=A0A4P2QRE6_SORCE|nr:MULTISPECIES: hypothetical protein [Sorangium]AUX32501.1 uncharacterized protein SOCE836_046410 [Sorangium cellulosum]WCQ91873.1 hypothetical protein NQZ70_04600 [Sorangium sp. Soce836]